MRVLVLFRGHGANEATGQTGDVCVPLLQPLRSNSGLLLQVCALESCFLSPPGPAPRCQTEVLQTRYTRLATPSTLSILLSPPPCRCSWLRRSLYRTPCFSRWALPTSCTPSLDGASCSIWRTIMCTFCTSPSVTG